MSEEHGRNYAALLEEKASTSEPNDSPPSVSRLIEALLFAGGEPLTAERACQVLRGLSTDQFVEAVQELGRHYRRQNRPYTVHSKADGYYLALRPGFQALRDRLTGGPREARLALPALDVLAVIAYKQPITRVEIDSLRGSDSAAVLRQLVRLGLAVVLPKAQAGADGAFGTTRRFLDLFGLRSLDDLPQTMDLQQI